MNAKWIENLIKIESHCSIEFTNPLKSPLNFCEVSQGGQGWKLNGSKASVASALKGSSCKEIKLINNAERDRNCHLCVEKVQVDMETIVTMETTSKSEATRMVVNLPLDKSAGWIRWAQVPSLHAFTSTFRPASWAGCILVSACDRIQATCKGWIHPKKSLKRKRLKKEICLEY